LLELLLEALLELILVLDIDVGGLVTVSNGDEAGEDERLL
jgi:hypothetical protein